MVPNKFSWFLFCILISLAVPSLTPAHDSAWPGKKLEKMYPEAQSFEQRNLYVSSMQKQRIEEKLGSPIQDEDLKPSIYFAVVKRTPEARPQKVAVMIFMDALGQNGRVETGVVLNTKGELEKLEIFENNDPPALFGPSFTEQFKNKTNSQPFTVGTDITAPQGQEKTAQAIATAARRGMLIINELFRKK